VGILRVLSLVLPVEVFLVSHVVIKRCEPVKEAARVVKDSSKGEISAI
jgi:hypothetical protein